MLFNAFAEIARDDSVNSTEALLRRVVKLLESSGMVDAQTRQRITVDSFAAGVTLPAVTTVSTVTAVTTVGTVTLVSNLAAIAGDSRPLLDLSRIAYNTGIRSKLN